MYMMLTVLVSNMHLETFHCLRIYACETFVFFSLFRNTLYNDFRRWLHEITGFVDLTDQVDMSCAKYEHTGKNLSVIK